MNMRFLIVFIVLSAFIITCTDSKSRKKRYAPSHTISRRKRSAPDSYEEQCFSEKCLGKRLRRSTSRSTSRSPSKATNRKKRQVHDFYVDLMPFYGDSKFPAKAKPRTTAKPPKPKKPVQKPKPTAKPAQIKQKIVPKTTGRPVSAKPANAKPANIKPASVNSANVKPENAKPANVKPAIVKPANVKPANAKPSNAKPANQSVLPKPNSPKIVELTRPMLEVEVNKSDVKKPGINMEEVKMPEIKKSEIKAPGKPEEKKPEVNLPALEEPKADVPQAKKQEAHRPQLDISEFFGPRVMMPDFQKRGPKKQKDEPRGELYISKLFIQEDLEPRDMSYKRPLRDSDREHDELPPGERELTIKDLEDKVVTTDFARKKHFIQLDQAMGLRRAVMALLFVVIVMPALLFLLMHCCSRNPPKQKTEEEQFMESLLSKPLLSPNGVNSINQSYCQSDNKDYQAMYPTPNTQTPSVTVFVPPM